MAAVDPFGLSPDEALTWFRQKGLAPRFDWRDLWAEQHTKAFTVAKATQLDVLADLYQAVSDAIEKGQSLGEFRKGLRPMLQAKGWWGEKDVTDPLTGEVRTVQLGSARRLQTIYSTNLRMAHAAGRWQRIERTANQRPWLRYVAIEGDGRTRKEHLAWHGTILRFDDPWWKAHYPPNGWGCRCKVQQLSDRDLVRYGFTPSSSAPNDGMVLWKDERNGVTRKVPTGIDPGFDYNAGEGRPEDWDPTKEPAVDPEAPTFRDYGRPPMRDIPRQPEVTERWPTPRNASDKEDVLAHWRAHFGGDSATVADPTGAPVTFNLRYLDHLLEAANKGDAKRATLVPQAHETVLRPYEIWLTPTRIQGGLRGGQVALRKRYIQVFDGPNGQYLLVAELTSDGQVAWTSYSPDKLDKLRAGCLLYAAPEVQK